MFMLMAPHLYHQHQTFSVYNRKAKIDLCTQYYTRAHEMLPPEEKTQPTEKFPKLLTSLHQPDIAPNSEYINDTYQKYTVTDSQAYHLEEATRNQAVSPLWFEHRKGRVTASKAHDVLRMREQTAPDNIIVEIINQDLVVQFTKDSGTKDYKVWPEIADISVVSRNQIVRQLEQPETISKDPLLYWHSNCQRLPRLAKLAVQYLAIPATSAPVERLFSTAGKTFRPERCRLADGTFEKLMMVKCNGKMLK
ncbi:unnamed protein product [Mytilus edulis]|uniref:HAT C-terminal dimerisation domain-containing protein n=1 Tax=Mytilus edulis TaxID=6550 RepID=A0A8S3V825_MYTED|nr:unnamed protein product [Mytilus edulis]